MKDEVFNLFYTHGFEKHERKISVPEELSGINLDYNEFLDKRRWIL